MNKINLFLIALLITNFSSLAQESIPYPTIRSIKKADLSPGKRDFGIKMSNGGEWKTMINIPDISVGDSVDLILALHWGVVANENREFMECLILPSIDQNKYIVVSPIANQEKWWTNPKELQLLRLIKYMKKYWPIDDIIVVGYSDGGTGAVHFASNHSDKLDAAIALAGYYPEVRSFEIPTYVIHSENDELFDYSMSSAIMKAAEQANSNLKFVACQTLSHFQGCGYVELLKEGFEWVEKRIN